MRSAILLLGILIAGCAQSDQRKPSDTPVVTENPPLSERLHLHKRQHDQQKAATDATAETTVDGVVAR